MLKNCLSLSLLITALFSPPLAIAEPTNENNDPVEQGRRIYEQGLLTSGKELEGTRAGKVQLKGADAACVNCHRRSGMGSVEGDNQIQPITGNYLFNPDKRQVSTMDPRSGKKFNQTHPPYDDGTLAVAIATGMNNSGKKMLPLMPNYALDKQDMEALTAYLKQLSVNWSAGINGETIHLATIITPEVEPERRKAFLDTLRLSVIQKNGGTATSSNKTGRRHMASAAEFVLGTERKWVLHIWELNGEPDTWTAQLNEKLKVEPIFAVLSGLSNNTWQPIHNFCETNRIPCWFPSVALPETSESFYNLYFSRGVLLEADVLAKTLNNKKTKHIVQIHRDETVANRAAQRLTESLAKSHITNEDRLIKGKEPISIQTLGGLKPDDIVIFWLRNQDITELAKAAPPTVKAMYFSTELQGETLPQTWHANSHLVYPYQLPEKRQSNLTNFHAWHNMKKLPIVDEAVQSEAFFAVEFLTETLSEMLDNLYRDYLIERAESMLSRSESAKSEQQIRERQMRSKTGTTAQQQGTSIYPHLGLSIKQHFASKGAYIVHYNKQGKLVAESDWLIP